MDASFYISSLLFALLGTMFGSVLSLLPGLHIYNVIGFALLIYFPIMNIIDPFYMVMLFTGMVVGYALLFTIPTVYFSTPDDSTLFIILPGQKYLAQGRGHEAVMLTGLGGLIALFFIVLLIPLAAPALIVLRDIFADNQFWIIGAIIVFILMTEWPKDFGRGRSVWQRLKDGWSTLLAGYLSFLLAALLGIIVLYRTVVPLENAFQSLMPVFIGLFAVPAVLINIISAVKLPPQFIARSIDVRKHELLHGTAAGCAGGFLGAFTPAITPGPAALLAGHATASKDDRIFILSQGANRVVYYVGVIILFFLPMLHKRKGGLTININLFFVPETMEQFFLIAAAIAICGAVAFMLLLVLSRLTTQIISRFRYQSISCGVLVFCIIITFIMTSWQGLLILAVATCIGLIPNMFFSRRINLLAVLLVPIWLSIAGYGPTVAGWLGL